jgi:hypothetical protein
MMHGLEKSDLAIVAMKPANKGAARGLRSGWSQGRGPRGTRTRHARDGLRAAVACHRGWNAYGRPQGKGRRRAFTALLHHVTSTCERRSWRSSAVPHRGGWRDVAGLRGGNWRNLQDLHEPGSTAARTGRCPCGDGSFRSRTGDSARWACRAGRQDRPACSRHRAQCDLRGRLPRLLVRVPARARAARCIGRLVRGDQGQAVNWILDADIGASSTRSTTRGCCASWSTGSATSASSGWCASGSRRASWSDGHWSVSDRGRHKAR